MNPERCIAIERVFLELEQGPGKWRLQGLLLLVGGPRVVFRPTLHNYLKDGILAHTDPKGDMPEDTPTDA